MYGATSISQREKMRTDFQEGKYNILVGNISVLALGLNLSRGEQIIILDPSLIYSDNEQVGDRFIPTTEEEAIAKEGQTIVRLLCNASVDIHVNKSLNKKMKETDIVNDYIKHLEKRLK